MNTITRKALAAELKGTAKGFTAVITAETLDRRAASAAAPAVRGAARSRLRIVRHASSRCAAT